MLLFKFKVSVNFSVQVLVLIFFFFFVPTVILSWSRRPGAGYTHEVSGAGEPHSAQRFLLFSHIKAFCRLLGYNLFVQQNDHEMIVDLAQFNSSCSCQLS